jgi:uroporphyrinogen-III synthase
MSIDFKGRRVVSFASRRAEEISDLIKKSGGKPIIAPSLREIPLENNTEAMEFARLLLAGWVDTLILTTGVGTRLLVKAVATEYDSREFLEALKAVDIVALGPKPLAAMKELGLSSVLSIPEPFTVEGIALHL